MELDRAISQISEIHAQLAKGEVFRGYRSLPIAATGLLALSAALVQASWVDPGDTRAFTLYWLTVAAIAFAICAFDVWNGYRHARGTAQKRRTRHAVLQFAPAIAGGLLVSVPALGDPALATRLPALWALLYALGLFASRLSLPRALGWVALGYLAAAGWLFLEGTSKVPSPWGMGLTFGLGQLALAWVLFTNLERGYDDGHA